MTARIPEIRSRVERAIDAVRLPWAIRPYLAGECIIAKGSGSVTVCEFNEEDEPQTAFILNAPSDVRYLLSALTARDALLKRCAEMLRKHDRCDHDGQGFDETCPECHAFMDTDPHLESCPYAALMREIEDAK